MLKVFRLCYSYINSWIPLESPLYGLTRSLEQYFFALCEFAWQSDVTLRLLIVQKCNNKKTWVFVFFRICFHLSMCKITFFSCFVVISNVFTRFINDSVSLRIEPLTVRNCSPCDLFSLLKFGFVGVHQYSSLNTLLSYLQYRLWKLKPG